MSNEKQLLEESHNNQLRDLRLGSNLKGFNYANGLSPEDGSILGRAKLDQALARDGINLVSDGNGSYKLMHGDLEYQKDHKTVTLGDYIANVLTESKLLAANTKPETKPANQTIAGKPEQKGMQAYLDKIEEQKTAAVRLPGEVN